MNSDTGQIYRTPEEIMAALKRGEPLEPIGPRVAERDKARRQRKYSRKPFAPPHRVSWHETKRMLRGRD